MAQKYEEATVSLNPRFWAMVKAAANERKNDRTEVINVGIDPGETTGMTIWLPWRENELILKQIPTGSVVEGAIAIAEALPQTELPIHFSLEDYRVYGWKADDHKWAGLHTPQLIGALRYIIHMRRNCSVYLRMAQGAKAWATDEKLKMWGAYNSGMKHARDAQRHVITTLFFGDR